MANCPLCLNSKVTKYHTDEARRYEHCVVCDLVFVKDEYLLSKENEKKIYDHHQNNPNDMGYRKHLSKLTNPLSNLLRAQSCGLDYGSGPGPTLSIIMQEAGHNMKNYDPFYAADEELINKNKNYDFITMTEVIEHIYNANNDLLKVWGILKIGGVLGIMTGLNQGHGFFKKWHYKKDPTHVRFYSIKTFSWLAQRLSATLEITEENIIFLTKTQ